MNIRDHIEAGHYEKDERRRWLVPTESPGVTAVISDTDAGHCPNHALLGWLLSDVLANRRVCWWNLDGKSFIGGPTLLPPPPRKVKVTAWANIYDRNRPGVLHWTRDSADADAVAGRVACVPVTGEYEEPWS